MGLLNLFYSAGSKVQRLPSGSLTVDREGGIVSSTIASDYPPVLLQKIVQDVLRLFREARLAQLPFSEISLTFASLQITARELRGGAIIFLSPKIQTSSTPTN
jgi:hypothetical protein